MNKVLAILLATGMCLILLAACGVSNDVVPVSDEPQISDSVPPLETGEPAAEESTEPEPDEEETYIFEGPGIFETVADVPATYKEAAINQGTVERVSYHNGIEDKYLNIYLPNGYYSGTEHYNVLYLIHGGGGGSPENFIRTDELTNLQKAIDNMIQNGDVEPFILVAPTWKTEDFDAIGDGDYNQSLEMTRDFAQNELAQYVIPIVDENYRTNATREGRAFSGFSMGGVTTWFALMYDMDYFKYFIPMSGDCWAVEKTGGATKPVETVAALEESVTSQGYTGEDFVVYVLTGAKDYALPNLAPQIYAMQDSEMFVFGENTFFGVHESAAHGDPWARTYLYNVLPLMWKD